MKTIAKEQKVGELTLTVIQCVLLESMENNELSRKTPICI